MKASKEQLDKIEQTLIAAHRRPEEVQFPPDWRQQVMEDIQTRDGAAAAQPEVKIATKAPRRILAWAAAAGLAVIAGWLILANLDRHDPWITLKPDLAALEPRAVFWLEAGDVDSGLRRVKVTVIQREVEIEVVSHDLEPPGAGWSTQGEALKQVNLPLDLDAKTLGLQEGKATLVITAHDLSWRNGFKGRITTLKKEIVIYYQKSP
jgi:hypothetical protein